MDIKDLLQRKGEKIALGASILLLVAYGIYAFAFAAADPARADVVRKAREVQARLNSGEADVSPPRNYSQDLEAAWTRTVATDPGNDWLCYRPTNVRPKVVATLDAGTANAAPPRLFPPKLVAVTADLGRITLEWTPGTGTTLPAADMSFVIYRKGPEDSAFMKIRELTDDVRYDDTNVTPKRKYLYKLQARTDDRRCEPQETAFSNEMDATAMGNVQLTLIGVASVSGQPVATVEVSKHMGGEWQKRSYPVPMGQEIGKVERKWDPASKQMVEVDFRTGWTSLRIEEVEKEVLETKRVPKVVDGEIVDYEEREIRRKIKVRILICKDEEGKEQSIEGK